MNNPLDRAGSLKRPVKEGDGVEEREPEKADRMGVLAIAVPEVLGALVGREDVDMYVSGDDEVNRTVAELIEVKEGTRKPGYVDTAASLGVKTMNLARQQQAPAVSDPVEAAFTQENPTLLNDNSIANNGISPSYLAESVDA